MHKCILASSALRWRFLAALFRGPIGVAAIGCDCFLLPRFGVVCTSAIDLLFTHLSAQQGMNIHSASH